MESEIGQKSTREFTYRLRNLPHFELAGSAYFLTFITVKQLALPNAAKNIVLSSIKFHADKKYRLFACVVMDDHVHMILLPLEKANGEYYSISEIMHSIKSYSANRIQRLSGVIGSVWMDENYDRVVRDEEDLKEKLNYILNNPLKSGLADSPENYRWLFFDCQE
jgi:putative transposase